MRELCPNAVVTICSIYIIGKGYPRNTNTKGISEAIIQILEENQEMSCIICCERLLDSLVQKEPVHLVACQHPGRHICHAECMADVFTRMIDLGITCPTCSGDCRAMVRQALTSRRDIGVPESFQWKMLERMNVLPIKGLREIFIHMGFIPSDYKLLNEVLAYYQFDQVNAAVRKYIVINSYKNYEIKNLHEYLIAEYPDYNMKYNRDMLRFSIMEYARLLIQCFAGSLSTAQVMAMLDKFLQREYQNEVERQGRNSVFISDFMSSSHLWLPGDDAYALVLKLIGMGLLGSASVILRKSEAVHTMNTDQAFEILMLCLKADDDSGMEIFEYVWVHSIYMRNLVPERVQQIKQRVDEYLVALNKVNEGVRREKLNKIYSKLSEKILDTAEAIKVLKEVPDDELRLICSSAALNYLEEKGVMRTIACAALEDRKQILQCMLDVLHIGQINTIYLMLPESMADIETDLALLERMIGIHSLSFACYAHQFAIFVRRQYFGYEMLTRMLDILTDVDADTKDPLHIWLLIAAKHQGFFESLSDEKYDAILEKLAKAGLFTGIAILEKPHGGKVNYKSTVMENAESIVRAHSGFSNLLQMYMACQCADTYILVVWCKHITLLVKCLLEGERSGSEHFIMITNHLVVSICGSEHFASSVLDAEVGELIKVLLGYGNAGLGYISTFFVVSRSEQHVRVAKMELFKALTMQQLAEEDVVIMNTIGFNFEATIAGLTYLTGSGITKVLVPGTIDEPTARMIETADKHYLLRLLRDKIE